jgi:murein DD-endopeptidase MepM/ murein hydrolase activator NlpD
MMKLHGTALLAVAAALFAAPALAREPGADEATASANRQSAAGGALVPGTDAGEGQFRTLFMSWKKLDQMQAGQAGASSTGAIAIPSVQPVSSLRFTSNFGIRSDPFQGTARMHAGVDIPGPVGTPIYATADGVVAESGRRGGYGNCIEINHGKGIATRYGHMSKLLVDANTRVRRGQLIGLMGSTGRSTGSHLHYEVRIDGHAVNPLPFLTNADYLLAAQDQSVHQIPVSVAAPLHDED